MKRTLLSATAVALAIAGLVVPTAAPAAIRHAAAPAARAAQAAPATLNGAERSAAIAAASRSLESIKSLQGRFAQISPDGTRSEGAFWLQRPGKLRFEYDAPSPQLIVADGRNVAIQDRALGTVDTVPLRSTPLYFVLKRNINLTRDVAVTSVSRLGGLTAIAVRDRSGETDGQITLVFEGPSYALKRWLVTDGQGMTTDLTLQTARAVASIPAARFVAPTAPDPLAARGR